MHDSVMGWVTGLADADLIEGQDVLEVGSLDENGSVRSVIEKFGPKSYVGLDMREGPGVDVVLNIDDAVVYFGSERFGLILCLEMLEHAKDWRGAINVMKHLVTPEGAIVLSTRGPGFPYHPFPEDHWRFTEDLMWGSFADFHHLSVIEDPDPESPGVLVVARRILNAVPVVS